MRAHLTRTRQAGLAQANIVIGQIGLGTQAVEGGAILLTILEEAEEKLDDWNNRGGKDKLLPKALNKFKEAATQHIPQLRALEQQLKEKRELRALAEAIEEAELVTKASTN